MHGTSESRNGSASRFRFFRSTCGRYPKRDFSTLKGQPLSLCQRQLRMKIRDADRRSPNSEGTLGLRMRPRAAAAAVTWTAALARSASGPARPCQ